MTDDQQFIYIAGKKHPLAPAGAVSGPWHGDRSETDLAGEQLRDVREGVKSDLPYEPDPPAEQETFANVDAAFEHASERAREEREQHEADAEAEREKEDREQRQRDRALAEPSQDDEATWRALQTTAAQVAQRAQAVQEARELLARAPPGQVTQQHREQLAQAEAAVAADVQWLQQAGQHAQQWGARKQLNAAKSRMFEAIPELRNDDTRKQFVADMAAKHGVTAQQVEQVTDPHLVGTEFRQWQKDTAAKRQAHLDRPRPVPRPRYNRPEMTPDEAMQELKTEHTMSAAMNALSALKQRERERRGR